MLIEHQSLKDEILELEKENKMQAKMISKLEKCIVAVFLFFSCFIYYSHQYNSKQILKIINDRIISFNFGSIYISKKELMQMITDTEASFKKQVNIINEKLTKINNDQLKHIDQSTINISLFKNFIPKTSNWKEINFKNKRIYILISL